MTTAINNTLSEYEQFLFKKRHSSQNFGIDPIFMPDRMFDFQKYVAEYAIKKGRCAVFLDTGLGKTIVELTTATNYIRSTNKRVLIITPLAVAFQFLTEAEKFEIDDVSYSRYGKLESKIVICNFEMLKHFNPEDFDCVIIDESSALKNEKGSRRNEINAFIKKVKYRFLFTATPSPNDFIELGTSSEALGYLGYTDMLTKFFRNNEDTISPQKIGVQWVLKGHAQNAFFEWVSGWSISARKPSDLGFSDERYILPELLINYHEVKNQALPMNPDGQMLLFTKQARTNPEIRLEQKQTIKDRCEKALELSEKHPTTVYWTNLNPEADLMEQIDKNAIQLKGGMPLEKKEEILLAFSKGEITKLITKPRITCFGLNWQHCGHTVFFPTFSHEQYYQAIRRFWRFGRLGKVICDMVYSEGQGRILQSLDAKAKKSDELFTKLNYNLHKNFEIKEKLFDKEIILPPFLNQ